MSIQELKDKILSNIIEVSTGCWEWQGKLEINGYARFFLDNKRWLVHRASYFCFNGIIPPFTMILHKCHNRKCANPDHLYAGSHTDNMRDMKESGRACHGENHIYKRHPELIKKGEECPFSILTKNQVIMIRELYKIHRNKCFISRITGFNRKTIADIMSGKTWSHIDENS